MIHQKINLGMLLALLGLIMTSCFQAEITVADYSWLSIDTKNIYQGSEDYLSCDGGVRSRIYLLTENIEVTDTTSPVDELLLKELPNFNANGVPIIHEGMHIQIEAWCYNQDGQEAGYAKVLGRLVNYGDQLSYNVSISQPQEDVPICQYYTNESANPTLLERRGNPPCIVFSW